MIQSPRHKRLFLLALLVVIVGGIAWMSRGSRAMGWVELSVAPGSVPVSVEILDNRNRVLAGPIEAPTTTAVQVPAGEAQLRVLAPGRWSETTLIEVEKGSKKIFCVGISARNTTTIPLPEGSVRLAIPGALLVSCTDELQCYDGTTGKLRWRRPHGKEEELRFQRGGDPPELEAIDDPIVADLNGDSTHEIVSITCARTDLNSLWSSYIALEAIDATTRERVWRYDLSRRPWTIVRMPPRILLGPPLSPHGPPTIFVASILREGSWRTSGAALENAGRDLLCLEALRGSDGRVIFTRRHPLPANDPHHVLSPLRWGPIGADGWPALLVTRCDSKTGSRLVWRVHPHSLRLDSVLTSVNELQMADLDGDGRTDWCITPSQADRITLQHSESPISWRRYENYTLGPARQGKTRLLYVENDPSAQPVCVRDGRTPWHALDLPGADDVELADAECHTVWEVKQEGKKVHVLDRKTGKRLASGVIAGTLLGLEDCDRESRFLAVCRANEGGTVVYRLISTDPENDRDSFHPMVSRADFRRERLLPWCPARSPSTAGFWYGLVFLAQLVSPLTALVFLYLIGKREWKEALSLVGVLLLTMIILATTWFNQDTIPLAAGERYSREGWWILPVAASAIVAGGIGLFLAFRFWTNGDPQWPQPPSPTPPPSSI